MSKLFITLSILMGVVVLSSNYLVQFPINYYGLSEILTFGAFSYPVAFLITDLANRFYGCLLYTSPSPRDRTRSRMPSSA